MPKWHYVIVGVSAMPARLKLLFRLKKRCPNENVPELSLESQCFWTDIVCSLYTIHSNVKTRIRILRTLLWTIPTVWQLLLSNPPELQFSEHFKVHVNRKISKFSNASCGHFQFLPLTWHFVESLTSNFSVKKTSSAGSHNIYAITKIKTTLSQITDALYTETMSFIIIIILHR